MDKLKIKKEILNKINQQIEESLRAYQKTIKYMAADAPIEILCLPKTIQTILLNNNIIRVYDLFDADLTKIKGLGKTRVDRLTASLDEFLLMR